MLLPHITNTILPKGGATLEELVWRPKGNHFTNGINRLNKQYYSPEIDEIAEFLQILKWLLLKIVK